MKTQSPQRKHPGTYDTGILKKLEDDLKARMREEFVDFFSDRFLANDGEYFLTEPIRSLEDAGTVHAGAGFYIIMSDCKYEENECRLVVDGLKAIYRGHCHAMKARLLSHLFNDHYRRNLPERGVRYDVCMKLDGNNGINIDAPPYSQHRWGVILCRMKGSSKMMREQAESAFDDVFSRPAGSRDKASK